MDIKSASKAHTAEHKIDDRTLTTEYYEPAAIPSAASPQNTNSTYSTSPGSTRFANSHGTTEEVGTFNDRFYDRNNSRVAEGEYIRRPNYHDSRGRNRDRGYRNGPYNNAVDRHRPLNSSWSYDSTRSYNSETGYGTTSSETNDRRSSDSQSTKKKTNSRSGSRSVSPSGSASSRSPTRSRSQSSSSSTSSTTSQASSSTSSPKSRRIAAAGNASHQPVVHSDDRRPLAICVRNLPLRSSDTSLKDGLFHEYKKHGKVTWVKIVGQGSDRHAIVCFKKPEDVDKALEVSYDKLFFGCKIEVAPYQGYDVDDNELRPYEAEIDEFHPKATRTLFIGNLEKDVTASDLRKHFDQFGEIIEIDIKKQGAVSSYAFCQYSDIISVVKAIRAMDGEHLGNNRIKLGFGKSMPTNCVWVDGVTDSVNEKYLTLQFDSFGPITQVIIDRDKGQALIFYEQVITAQAAVNKMRGVNMRGRKMQVDFASRECQESFYEHLEKQGHVTERVNFEERRDSSSTTTTASAAAAAAATTTTTTPRNFDSSVTTANRYSRYETPSRPRTSSYSSRSNVAGAQCNAAGAVNSPGAPGSVTPRGGGSRSRLARFSEYYDQNATDFGERRYRSYDEYSQGSGASHEDGYEHDYPYNRESPSHADPTEARAVPHNPEHATMTFPPPDIRNLQKERYHLLEQLEDYASSGDELVSPKKRMRLDIEGTAASDVIIEANRDHRKVMEVRRSSEGSLKHHSRRPSVDNKHGVREMGMERPYLPHAVCKRRKTGGSDSSSRLHHHDLSGSESVCSSRPGTPLCDERPENFPTEPRRVPREREGPLSLPLPRFAAQVMGKGSVSVAGIKGQKDNVLASPPPAATSPRISNPVIPSLAQVPPPASPPPRPPSLSSNSSDSDVTPPSPSLDERIRSLDEKYEKWSGSRAVSAASSEALVKLDATASERFRFSYKLLDLDLKELQPSEIVKSVLAKPSVFDEDSKRLENVGEKYDLNLFAKTPTTVVQTSVPAVPLSAPPVPKAATTATVPASQPKTTTAPTALSPRSSGSTLTTAKGLQYPFPSHPPVQSAITTSTTQTLPLQTSSAILGRATECRLKPSPTATNSQSVTCKSANRNASGSATQNKIGDSNAKNASNIPLNSSDISQSVSGNSLVDINSKQIKCSKVTDKSSEKVANRRDSVGSTDSPRANVKIRRNSDCSLRRTDPSDKQQSDNCDISSGSSSLLEKKPEEGDKDELERLEKERLEKERLEKEKLEKEQQLKKERDEKERKERDEREEQERSEREKRERREREEKDRRDREEQEKHEKERKRDEDKKHKDDNHEKRHRDGHQHKDNSDNTRNDKNTKDNKSKDGQESYRKETHESRNSHENRERHNNESRKEDKSKHHAADKDFDKRKESSKENRENNVHDKIVNILITDVKENSKPSLDSRHFSLDLDKNKIELSRRKERNNSLPASVGSKRRISSQDFEVAEEIKKIKLSQEHRKISERRDSKDSRSEEKIKNKHKNNIAKIIEEKMRQEKFNIVKELSSSEERRKDKEREKDDKHKHKQKTDKHKSKDKPREKESLNSSKSPGKEALIEKDFLTRLDLHSSEDLEKMRQRKEMKEKRKPDGIEPEDPKKSEDRKKEKRFSLERKSRDENPSSLKSEERKLPKKERIRKVTQNSSDAATDSDEPKKQPHSIFDIVDDEPAYISMYDKVKARSCKNMQKQEEEKRQEKLKAKFNQLKQSRAKREEKKRSTSWDEDSDSDHERRERFSKGEGNKARRTTKMLILSSDEEDPNKGMKPRKKRDIYTDSDSDKHRQTKSENMETSDEEAGKHKSLQRKLKSRIASDTSDDEFKKIQTKCKFEIFSDSETDNRFTDLEEKSHKRIKEEEKYIKKEKKKHQDLTTEQINAQIFGDSPVPDVKPEDKYDNGRIFGDLSSAEDNNQESKKDKSDVRKKHKKKTRRQKQSLTSEEETKIELAIDSIKDEGVEKPKGFDKKKQHGKKDKKKDKSKDDEKHKDKTKKSKKSKSELMKSDSKRDGKIENIFGSFSDDSENGKDHVSDLAQSTFLERFHTEKLQMYGSDSDSISHIEKELRKSEEKERKEDHKKRKEKKRREKEKRLREEELNDNNSMDYVNMGKQLEANIKDDSTDILEAPPPLTIKLEPEERSEDVFRFTEGDESQEIKADDKKEGKEKKKKRKKSKDEKHKHHHHHHDKSKVAKSPEIEKELELAIENVKSEIEKPVLQSPSLPNIIDLPSSPLNKSPALDVPLLSAISTSSTSTISTATTATLSVEKKREKLIPGFGTEIDEKIHETAVKSISEFELPKSELAEGAIKTEDIKSEKAEVVDDKPRVVISQEETEDAVAALLGESFGGNEYSNCYTDEQPTLASTEQESGAAEENTVEDLEEMRQAVQSLNSGDLEIKPETPQSEHELQIDTDTEEQDEVGLRYDQSPRTPEMVDLSQPPKTPDIPSYFRSDDQNKAALVIKAANLSSPPSLTPIKHIAENRKVVENVIPPPPPPLPPPPPPPSSPPPLAKVEAPKVLSTEAPQIKIETRPNTTTNASTTGLVKTSTIVAGARPFNSPPIVKISEPPPTAKKEVLPIAPEDNVKPPVLQNLKPHVSIPYSMSIQMQYNSASTSQRPPTTTSMSCVQVTKSVPFNRLPIVPIMMAKPFQPATMALPQPKIAQVTESCAVHVEQQPRVTYQSGSFAGNAPSPARVVVQNALLPRGLPLTHVPSTYSYSSPAPKLPDSPKIQAQQSVIAEPKSIPLVIHEAPKLISLTCAMPTPSIVQSAVKLEEFKKEDVKQEPPKVLSQQASSSLAVAKVTEELNLSLKEECTIEKEVANVDNKPEIKEQPKVAIVKKEEAVEKSSSAELEVATAIGAAATVIKKNEKLEDEKGDVESIESDISKERSSAELANKDDGMDSKEDSDYWSAKEVNIDSVIKKVDALCSADELSDRSSEMGKDDWYDHELKNNAEIKSENLDESVKAGESSPDLGKSFEEEEFETLDEKEVITKGNRRGGRTRGRKSRGGVQTRRTKSGKEEVINVFSPSSASLGVVASITTPSIGAAKRGGRGTRSKSERKITKSDLDSTDVYEFRDDSDENNINKDRPRLILTIKSPALPNPNNCTSAQTTIVKESIAPKVESKDDFVSPTNTRKSRRLQERDVSRNTVDDTIEDVVRNTAMVTRSSTAAAQAQIRRSARQTTIKAIQEGPRKSPRGAGRKKDRRTSENTDDSSEEKTLKEGGAFKSDCEIEKPAIKESSKEGIEEEKAEVKEKPHVGLKAAVLRRVKGEMNQQEPMTLIDPVTGLLTPMRECEEGRYIPVSGNAQMQQVKLANLPPHKQTSQGIRTQGAVVKVPADVQTKSVIASAPIVLQQHKPQSLKAHVLSSQAARNIVNQQAQQKLVTVAHLISQPPFVVKSGIPIGQHLSVNVSSPNLPPAHLSPRSNIPSSISKTIHTVASGAKVGQPTPPSPNQVLAHINQPKQPHVLQPNVSKTHLSIPVASNVVNTQMAHMKQQAAISKGQVMKPHNLHPQPQILTGAVASPPLKQGHHQQPIAGASSGRLIQGSASVPSAGAKSSMEPPKVEVSISGCVMVPHPSLSPQGQPRHILQSGLPLPAFEASLGEAMTHFSPGSVKLRSHDLLPAHYMHPQHVMYQQYLRQSYHLPRSPLVSSNLEKSGDGQEGEEAPVELRRPGSVGLALTGRSTAVPHGLQSPHDRTTDSPQVGQVYNMHNSRMPHYHPARYFEQATEPPPAHRPLTSHGSLAALNERSLGHINTLGTSERAVGAHLPPDRPLSSHLTPDRPVSSHLTPDRPLSSHSALSASHINTLGSDRPISTHISDRPLSSGFTLGTGLGAAGNLLGAVARHVGAEAPASQRGLQAATPPHASQVPAQAESLLMLLKQYPCMWQGLLALKNDQAAVQMYFVSGNDQIAKFGLPKNMDGSTPPLRIFQRMRLEPPQVEGVARKMQMENEHCMLLALPCGHDHMDVLKQSTNLTSGFITYLQQKQAAGIVNVAAPGTTQPPAYVVHIFPSCDFVNENLRRIAPNLLERVSDIAHLLIVITTV